MYLTKKTRKGEVDLIDHVREAHSEDAETLSISLWYRGRQPDVYARKVFAVFIKTMLKDRSVDPTLNYILSKQKEVRAEGFRCYVRSMTLELFPVPTKERMKYYRSRSNIMCADTCRKGGYMVHHRRPLRFQWKIRE